MKFKLVEDTLLETKSKYNLGPLLKGLLVSFMKDVNANKGSQRALKMYLCTNRGVNFSDSLDVHHINGNHQDYRDSNLALVEHNKHLKLHSDCQNEILKELYTEVNQEGPGRIELDDLNPDIENVIRTNYVKLLQQEIKHYRVD